MDEGERGLKQTADNLRQTADDYDRMDAVGADRLWAAAGRTWDQPKSYREHDVAVVSSGFSKGAAFNLAVPKEYHDAEKAKASVVSSLATVNKVVEWITGYDLLGQAMPIVFSEWGVLRHIAEAHNEMERGYDLIAEDLTTGMDALSAHWTSDEQGGASTVFDFYVRERWIRGFRALANASNSCQQTYESIANVYEYIVNSFLIALNFYITRIKKAIAAENRGPGESCREPIPAGHCRPSVDHRYDPIDLPSDQDVGIHNRDDGCQPASYLKLFPRRFRRVQVGLTKGSFGAVLVSSTSLSPFRVSEWDCL